MSKLGTFKQEKITNINLLEKAAKAAGYSVKRQAEVEGYRGANYGVADLVIQKFLPSPWEMGVKYSLGVTEKDGELIFKCDDVGGKVPEYLNTLQTQYNIEECRQLLEDMNLQIEQRTETNGNIIVEGFNEKGEGVEFTINPKTHEVLRHITGVTGTGCVSWAEKTTIGNLIREEETSDYYSTYNPPQCETISDWHQKCIPSDNEFCG